ncbi:MULTISPECIES: polyprenyl synthetase family protein [unclassified Ruegeria]|uniref:polyprenyl synthetase family protein n=1 Tax=unclassified Ruegeria TaxID=2625375 RepID=UPI001489D351|nr:MULTISPECIES: polyprenyl synthetase family protein [unclassified Ruegeria]NOD76170.1 polyprenyl synthetase family protein [Ruegeria sp. HKCCD4332]NOD90140.1 polyprenyl synthetase family protein [Ruegeria sp. HKCCD4318]NOE15213.1 polyprenyl synthetase family protein [Ruegeria sp. HKCCD4318-2]NOG10577.1 polyprenyl synthetase family protein [Ruegeria sp. HKCCD4315]
MFRERLAQDAARIQAHFDLILGALDDIDVTRAMAYATQGGKRLRGFLVQESARLHDVDVGSSIWPATGIEALHAYSLVHDDLPCMDDDDLRRGRPTVHVKWNEGTGVLAGDALQTLAFELCTRPEVGDAQIRAELALTLAQASGAQGMVLGQALDIAAETAATPLTLEQITHLQAGKTGALIEWSVCAGARLAQADPTPLRDYAQALGLAFQIADDILDVEGDAEKAGKRLQKDADAGKATFVSLLGLEAAKSRATELVETACAALDGYGASAETLKDAARFVIARDS